MDDIAGKLTELLSNPDILDTVKNLSGLFGAPANNESDKNTSEENENGTGFPDIDLGTMATVMKLIPLINSFSADDETIRLLNALRPFLGKERYKKLDGAIMLVRLMRILPALRESGLLG